MGDGKSAFDFLWVSPADKALGVYLLLEFVFIEIEGWQHGSC
jgi:hypothetical protein